MSIDLELTPLEQDLVDAIRMKRLDRVDACLRQGVAVDFVAGNFGERPLHLAAQADAAEIISFLVEKGAAIDATDMQGQTPLFHAAEHNAENAAFELLKLKANPNHLAHTGRTAIFSAARFGHSGMIRRLIDGGADANFSAAGSTPLFYAVNGSHFEAVKALVEGGARVELRNSEGLTAGEMLARRNSDFQRDVLTARFLNATHLQHIATTGVEKPVTVLKPLSFRRK